MITISLVDRELLTQLKTGSAEAVRLWFYRYHQRLLKYIGTRIPTEHDAQEVTQDIFLSCLKHLPLFRGESSIWTWMVNVARHEVADYYRRYYAKKLIHALPLNDFFDIGELVDAHEVSQKVKNTLLRMSAESRELLQLKYVDHKTMKDIAGEMNKTVKAIESLLFRARNEFRELYSLDME